MKYYSFLLFLLFFISCKNTEIETNIVARNKTDAALPVQTPNNRKFQDIKEIDFKNFAYAKVSGQENDAKTRCLLDDFTVKNGLFEEKNGKRFNWTSEIRFSIEEVLYGDLTDDGKDEAIIKSSCVFGLTDPKTEAYIYTLQNNEPTFLTLIEGGGAVDGAIKNLKILPKGVLEVITIGSTTGRKSEINRKYTNQYILKEKKLVSVGKTREEKYQLK
jgi:hypothetical protein